tara:strand:- start:713 stop:2197 length:1485 start_codon:yes stop_codon:yes gene_type:complete
MNLFFIPLLIFILSSGTAYLGHMYLTSYSNSKAIIENKEIAKDVKSLLIKDIHRINNSSEFFAPVGDTSISSYTALPQSFGDKRYTSGGVAFQYCPVSGSDTSYTSQVSLSGGGNYSVSTINNPARSGYEYVNGSELTHDGVIAFILSPIGNKNNTPSCEDIQKVQGNYIVPKGQVFAITETDLLVNEQSNAVIEARVNSTYTNDTSLEDGTELRSKSLVINLERFKNSTAKEMVVYLEDGTYNLPAGTLEATNIEGKRLSFVSNQNTVIDTPRIDMKGVDISFKDLDTTAEVVANTSRLTLDGAEVGSITAKGADIRAIDSRVVGRSTIAGSTFRVSGGFDFGEVQLLSGSKLNLIEANGYLGGTSLGIGILGSTVSMDGSTVEIGGSTAINNQGEVIVWNSTVTSTGATYGILSSNGGINRISNSDMFLSGSQPTYAFFDDNGTALVAGNGSFSGGQCFEGEIFDDLATITTAENGTQTVPNPNNQELWSCL